MTKAPLSLSLNPYVHSDIKCRRTVQHLKPFFASAKQYFVVPFLHHVRIPLSGRNPQNLPRVRLVPQSVFPNQNTRRKAEILGNLRRCLPSFYLIKFILYHFQHLLYYMQKNKKNMHGAPPYSRSILKKWLVQ